MLRGFRLAQYGGRLVRRNGDQRQQPPNDEVQPSSTTPVPAKAANTTCDICCESENQPVFKPCGTCNTLYCKECIVSMFRRAREDRSMMPPVCCGLMPLHVALPYLSEEEAQIYRAKFDEIVMLNEGFYCPNAQCAQFISGARIDEASKDANRSSIIPKVLQKGSTKHDSVLSEANTPVAVLCHGCDTFACTTCKDLAHPDSACNNGDAANEELDKQLKSWGYKRCPRCRNGVRRMYGCSHMQCSWCAAHFCWYCMKPFDHCERLGCDAGPEEYDDMDEEAYTDDESELAHPNDENTEPVSDSSAAVEEAPSSTAVLEPEVQPTSATDSADVVQEEQNVDGSDESEDESRRAVFVGRAMRLLQRARGSLRMRRDQASPEIDEQPEATQSTGATAPSTVNVQVDTVAVEPEPPARQHATREGNFDGRSPGHWMDSGLDFGEEPGEARVAISACSHTWTHMKVTVSEDRPWTEMQCHRCWKTISPKISKGKSLPDSKAPEPSNDEHDDSDEANEVGTEAGLNAGKRRRFGDLALGRKSGPGTIKALDCRQCGMLACPRCVESMKKTQEVAPAELEA